MAIATKTAFMQQKFIVDKSTHQLSEFIVFSDNNLTKSDWVSKSRFEELSKKVGSTPLEFPLKKSRKGNEDEGYKPTQGKAVKVTLTDDLVTFEVYVQNHGETWKLSHTHLVSKDIFMAYKVVVKNDSDVSKAEKERQTPEHFSLGLG